jgi:hypothetical protein
LTTFSRLIRRTTLAGCVALLCLYFAGCGESQPPAPPAPSKVIEKQLDSKDPKDRLEGAKQAEKMYGTGDATDKPAGETNK